MTTTNEEFKKWKADNLPERYKCEQLDKFIESAKADSEREIAVLKEQLTTELKRGSSYKTLGASLEGQLEFYRTQDYKVSTVRLNALEQSLISEQEMNEVLTNENTDLQADNKRLREADGFGTEDEHWASSLEELAEQFLNSYEAGEVITVHLSKDLGAKDYKYCFDAKGNPYLEALATPAQSLKEPYDFEWLKTDHFKLCEILNGIDEADLTVKDDDSINVKVLKGYIHFTNNRIDELERNVTQLDIEFDQRDDMRLAQITLCQLHNVKLVEALEIVQESGLLMGSYELHSKVNNVVHEAISTPPDQSSLDAYVESKYEVKAWLCDEYVTTNKDALNNFSKTTKSEVEPLYAKVKE